VGPLATADQEAAARLLGLPVEALDGMGLVTSKDGAEKGAATWTRDSAGNAKLGAIAMAPGTRLDQMYRLAADAAKSMLATGAKTGTFEIYDAALLRQLQSTFTISAEPIAWAPLTPADTHPRKETGWRIEVDLQDAIDQVAKATGP
jgi:hypothetical protein